MQTNKEKMHGKESAMGCLFVLLLTGVFIIMLKACSFSDGTESVANYDNYDYFDVHMESERFVRKRLKSPYSAEFCLYSEDNVVQLNDSTFYISNCFDSQNGYGAMIRSNYSCTITFYTKEGLVKCDSLVIN